MAGQAEKNGMEIGELCARIEELEWRVASLEKRESAVGAVAVREPVKTFLGAKPKQERKRAGASGVISVLGKAVLAIAGAYLLRAVAESGAVPRWIMLAAGIVYAGVWLVWAARSHRTNRFASGVYALTVAAIVAPLLWEGTVRFGVLTAGFAATVLLGYVAMSLGLAWKEKLEAIPWIAVVVGVGTAAALIVATHELGALTAGMLTIALMAECASWSGRWAGLRTVAGAGVIFALALIGVVMTSTEGVPESYRAMGAGEVSGFCLGMVAVYGLSLVVRGFGLKMSWTVLEIAQAVAAVVLGTWVSLRATHGGAAGIWGAVFLGMAVVCYWGVFKRFSVTDELVKSRAQNGRATWNRRVSANFAAGLMLAGTWLLLGGNSQVVLLSAAAICAVIVFARTGYLSLGMHGTFYLLAAGGVCGMFGYAGRALGGAVPTWPSWSFWVVAAAALASYLVGSRVSGDEWNARILWVVPAAVVGFAVAAVIVAGIVGFGGSALSASRLSMVRTVVTCVMALGLAYAGSHWNRAELGWVAYGAVGLGALKLVLEDLRFGNAGTLMVSLLFYGAILVLLPRVSGKVRAIER